MLITSYNLRGPEIDTTSAECMGLYSITDIFLLSPLLCVCVRVCRIPLSQAVTFHVAARGLTSCSKVTFYHHIKQPLSQNSKKVLHLSPICLTFAHGSYAHFGTHQYDRWDGQSWLARAGSCASSFFTH